MPGIGNPVDWIELPTTPAASATQTGPIASARAGERVLVLAEHGFRESHAVPPSSCAAPVSAFGSQVYYSHAARTEQQGVTGRSIETLVERRYPCRQELGLGTADCGDL
jgi:hypothetical protein